MSRRLQPQWLRQACEYKDEPLLPSAYDDEFDSNTIDPKWILSGWTGFVWDAVNPIDPHTTFTTGGARYSTQSGAYGKPSWLRVQPQASAVNGAGQVFLAQAMTVPTNAYIEAKMAFTHRMASQPTNDAVCGIGLFTDTTTLNDGILACLNRGNANAIQVTAQRFIAGAATTIGGATGDEDNRGQPFHTIGIQKKGTDYHIWALCGEHNWCWVGNITWAGTPTHARLAFWNTSTTAPGNMVMGVDYFRMSRRNLRT